MLRYAKRGLSDDEPERTGQEGDVIADRALGGMAY
jgi:hypothetical protein